MTKAESDAREPDDVIEALDRAARLEREILDTTGEPATPAEVARIEAFLGKLAPRRRTRRTLGWLAAGALLAAALWWGSRGPTDEVPAGTRLGAHELRVLEPTDEVEAFTVLRWQTKTSGQPRFRVTVTSEPEGTLLLEEPNWRGMELPLSARDTTTWKRVRVDVAELDAGGEITKRGTARAWLRGP